MDAVWQFLGEHTVELILGVATLILGFLTYRLSRREQRRAEDGIVGEGRKATLFLNREAMAQSLLEQYQRAESGDVIWGQCVGCDEYTPEVGKLIIDAAGNRVSHRLIANAYAPTVSDFRALFAPLSTADVVEGTDNAVRIQGLSSKEVVISIPELTQYTGLMIRDPQVVGIFRDWFDSRFESLKQARDALDTR